MFLCYDIEQSVEQKVQILNYMMGSPNEYPVTLQWRQLSVVVSQITAIRLFVQRWVQSDINEIKAHGTGPLWTLVISAFYAQGANKVEDVSISWRHHDAELCFLCRELEQTVETLQIFYYSTLKWCLSNRSCGLLKIIAISMAWPVGLVSEAATMVRCTCMFKCSKYKDWRNLELPPGAGIHFL